MKKITLIPIIAALCMFSCKEGEKDKKEVSEAPQEETQSNLSSKTYAEISVRDGGEWNDRKYEGGVFKNVEELDVPENHTDHSYYIRYEGPGWENSQIGYRLYLDWRNAIDIFGKKVDSIVLPYVGQDNFDSYHEDAPWGQDILKAGKALGIGGYGRFMNDTVAHFQTVGNTVAKVSNSENSSIVNISYTDWKTGDETIDLSAELTIYPEDRYTKAELTPSKEIEGLSTGIVKFDDISLMKKEGKEGKWAYIATYGAQTLVNDQDKLGMALFYQLDEVAEQKEGPDDNLVVFKPTTEAITYYFLGAWEQEPNGIKNEESFVEDLNNKLEELESNGKL